MMDIRILYFTVEVGWCRLAGSGLTAGLSSGEHDIWTMEEPETWQAYDAALQIKPKMKF